MIDIEYYNLRGKELHMKLPPGDIVFLCNVLHDYANLLEYAASDPENRGLTSITYTYNQQRCNKIRDKMENTISYSVEKAIRKCNKQRMHQTKEKDIGEDALVLAMKVRNVESKKEAPEKAELKKEIEKTIIWM